MTLLNPREFRLEIAKGNVPGHEVRNVTGQNNDVDTALEDLWTPGGSYIFPTAARLHNVASTSASDAAAGTGARTILLEGLDAAGLEVSEILTLNGLTVVPTVTAYLRLNRFAVLTAGSGGAPAGTLTATAQVDGTTSARIEPGVNRAQQLIYTVPAAKRAFLLRAIGGSGKGTAASANLEFLIRSRPLGGVFYSTIPISTNLNGTSVISVDFDGSVVYTARTDLIGSVVSSAVNSEANGALFLLVVDD